MSKDTKAILGIAAALVVFGLMIVISPDDFNSVALTVVRWTFKFFGG